MQHIRNKNNKPTINHSLKESILILADPNYSHCQYASYLKVILSNQYYVHTEKILFLSLPHHLHPKRPDGKNIISYDHHVMKCQRVADQEDLYQSLHHLRSPLNEMIDRLNTLSVALPIKIALLDASRCSFLIPHLELLGIRVILYTPEMFCPILNNYFRFYDHSFLREHIYKKEYSYLVSGSSNLQPFSDIPGVVKKIRYLGYLGPMISTKKQQVVSLPAVRCIVSFGTIFDSIFNNYDLFSTVARQLNIEITLLFLDKTGTQNKKIDDPYIKKIYKVDSLTSILPDYDILITHCGANSLLEAIISHTPLLGIPFLWDQQTVASIIQKKALGLTLDHRTMKASHLCRAITTLCDNYDNYLLNITSARKNLISIDGKKNILRAIDV